MYPIRFIQSIATLQVLWIFASIPPLANATGFPKSADSRIPTVNQASESIPNIIDRVLPRQAPGPGVTCSAGPDNVNATFQILGNEHTPGAQDKCNALLDFLKTVKKDITPGKNGICLPNITNPECCIDWKNNKGEMGLVSFEQLVAPLTVAIAQGSEGGGTKASLKDYLLAGTCTDIFVSKNGQFPA